LRLKCFRDMKYLYAYRNIATPAVFITLLSGYNFWHFPSTPVFLYLFWCKVIVSLLFIGYIHFFRASIPVFFMNVGIGRMALYSSILGIDIGLFVLLLTIIMTIK
jgi:hypothetical protein